MSIATTSTTVTEHEAEQVERANASGLQPIAFVHGLWLLPNSWDRWVEHFEAAGYVAITPGWPDDPETVAEAKDNPDVFAGKGIGDIADHVDAVIRGLDKKPAVIGHSFGGLLTQLIAGRGLAAASVAISPAPFRGVLPLPISELRVGSVVLKNPRNRHRAVPLSFEQFRYGFGNAIDEDEAKALYEAYSVPGSGEPIFQSAAANLNPWSEAKVDTKNPDRGPLLIIAADEDHTAPSAVAKSEFKKQQSNESPTEFFEFKGVGHSLVIDRGWRDVADKALEFVKKYV